MSDPQVVFKKIEPSHMIAFAALIAQLNREGVQYQVTDSLNEVTRRNQNDRI